jgi:hypothetical protein
MGDIVSDHAGGHARRRFLILVSACEVLLGCERSALEKNPEIVLRPGMIIQAITPQGTLVIKAGEDYLRTFEWRGCSESVRLRPTGTTEGENRGLFYPGDGISWWPACGGVYRAVIQEGQQHFDSETDAAQWLKRRTRFAYSVRNDGLVVGWDANEKREALEVEVWQVVVMGRKPEKLVGANDESVILSGGDVIVSPRASP